MLTVCALAISERPASAWVNSKFSVGLNWHYQSANTSVLWGLWRSGQIPGPEAFGPAGGPFASPNYPQPTQPFPYMGASNSGPQGGPYAPQMAPQAAPQAVPQGVTYNSAPPVQNGYYNPYQTVSYQPASYGYYPYQPTYYPTYGYSNYGYSNYGYQTPYYWYGQR